MQKGELEYAIRKAQDVFDQWNNCTGLIPKFCGYYYEALSVIETATKIGARIACGLKVEFDKNGNLIDNEYK